MNAPNVGAVEVTIVPTNTPRHPTKMIGRRPTASAVHTKKAPAICPT